MTEETRFHTSIGVQIFLGSIFFVFFLVSLYMNFKGSSELIYTILFGMGFVIFVIWIRTKYIEINSFGVAYYTGFGLKRDLKWQDIGRVTTIAQVQGGKGKYETAIYSNNPSKKDIKINIKLFGKKDLMAFANTMITHAKHATIDEVTKKMAAGRMPSIF
jgi:hypothetical protein